MDADERRWTQMDADKEIDLQFLINTAALARCTSEIKGAQPFLTVYLRSSAFICG